MATILFFNFDPKAVSRLSMLAIRCGARGRAVGKEDFSRPLGELLAGGESTPAPAEDFHDRMIVLCGLDNARAARFLDGLREAKLSNGVLKAFLTETNEKWDASTLHRELCAERDAIQKGQRAHGAD